MAFYVAIAPLLWATNFVLAKVLLQALSPTVVTTVRWAVAAALLGPLYVRAARRGGRFWDGRIVLLGLLGVTGFTELLYAGLQRTSAVNGGILYATTPVFTLFGEWLAFGARPGLKQLAGVLASMAGVAVVVTGGHLVRLRLSAGDALVLAAVVCWAAYTVIGRDAMRRTGPLEATGGAALFGVLSLVPWWGQAVHATWTPASLAGAIYLGTFPSVVAYAIWLHGVQRLGTVATAVVGNLLPFFTALMAYAFLGEAVTAADWVGGALICGGVVLVSVRDRPAPGA